MGLSGASAVNKTTGMGRVEINDSTINYVANSGSDSYNLTLTSTGTVSKGLLKFLDLQFLETVGLGVLVIDFT